MKKNYETPFINIKYFNEDVFLDGSTNRPPLDDFNDENTDPGGWIE